MHPTPPASHPGIAKRMLAAGSQTHEHDAGQGTPVLLHGSAPGVGHAARFARLAGDFRAEAQG